MYNRSTLWLSILTLLLLLSGCSSSDSERPEDEKAIREKVSSYVSAFNRQDSKTLAEHWSEEAEYFNQTTGEVIEGRENIKNFFNELFAQGSKETLELDTESITFTESDIAVEKGKARVVRPNEEPILTRYSVVYIKVDGEWLIDSILERETTSPNSHYEKFKELEWLLGKWVNDGDDVEVVVDTDWDKNKNFLVNQYTVTVDDEVEQKVTQIVAWDAHENQFRSWFYDTDGGFGEGKWKKEGEHWYVNTFSILPDGRKASSINVYKPIDVNTFTWSSFGRDVGGEILPNVDSITFVKVNDNNK